MLTRLLVRDVVLIERLELELGAGLTVLTGETGAGKSILLDSLGLALGERSASGLVRSGAEQASVTASFQVAAAHAVHALLAEHALSVPEGEDVVLRRVVTRDGRSRAYINDQPVGVGLLRRAGLLLVELQGQHEQIGLADPATHLDLLDAFGVAPELLARTRKAHRAWSAAAEALAACQGELAAAAREEEFLRTAIAELDRLAPQADEEAALVSTRRALQDNDRRAEAVASALSELNPRDRRSSSPAVALRSASRALQRLLPADDLSAGEAGAGAEAASGPDGSAATMRDALAALDQAEASLSDAETLLGRLSADMGSDPRLLDETESRLFALRAAARKHEVAVVELPELLRDLHRRLDLIDDGQARLRALDAALVAARAGFDQAAAALTASRAKAAAALDRAVMAELVPLRFAKARFSTALDPLPEENWSGRGRDRAAFLIAANPGEPPGPLGRVASGGELSRLMLALKVVLSGRSSVPTLIFDEVDSGVGGATAAAIGERLSGIAATLQVLVVTHSPQVAARGDRHLRIFKQVRADRTETGVKPLSMTDRREEIARMLAGERVTEAARAAAESLLDAR